MWDTTRQCLDLIVYRASSGLSSTLHKEAGNDFYTWSGSVPESDLFSIVYLGNNTWNVEGDIRRLENDLKTTVAIPSFSIIISHKKKLVVRGFNGPESVQLTQQTIEAPTVALHSPREIWNKETDKTIWNTSIVNGVKNPILTIRVNANNLTDIIIDDRIKKDMTKQWDSSIPGIRKLKWKSNGEIWVQTSTAGAASGSRINLLDHFNTAT